MKGTLMHKLFKNWAYLLFSDASNSVINFFVFMFLARKLSPEGYGEFNVAMALVSLFSVFALNIGTNQVVTREIAINPTTTKKLFDILVPIRLASFLLTGFCLILYTLYFEKSGTFVIVFSVMLVLANTIWDLSESIAFGHFVTKFTTIFNLTTSIVWLLVVILMPKKFATLEVILLFYAVLLLIRSFSYMFICYIKYIKESGYALSIGVKSIFLMSLPFLWTRSIGVFTEQVPILLLKKFSGVSQVGFYSVGFRFIIPITLAISTGLRAVFPFISKLYSDNRDAFEKKLIDGFTSVLIWGGTITTLLVVTSSWWIPALIGKAYISAVGSFNYLAWFGVVVCFDSILATVLSSTYQQNTLAIITTIDCIVILPLLYLGAHYGAMGLSAVRLFGVLFLMIYHIVVVIKVLKININCFSFYASCLYCIILVCITLFITPFIIKMLLIMTVFVLFLSIKKSPLRQSIVESKRILSSYFNVK